VYKGSEGRKMANASKMVEVKVIDAHHTNLHLRYGKTKLKVWDADKMAATNAIVNYVTQHGKAKVVKRRGYSGVMRCYTYFFNREYSLKMPVSKLKELVYVCPRNRNALTVQKILNFISQVESE